MNAAVLSHIRGGMFGETHDYDMQQGLDQRFMGQLRTRQWFDTNDMGKAHQLKSWRTFLTSSFAFNNFISVP